MFFFFNDTATTEIYTLSLHDALPICGSCGSRRACRGRAPPSPRAISEDRKSTRLNSSHSQISYAVFCLKKKKKHEKPRGERIERLHIYADTAVMFPSCQILYDVATTV